MYLKSFKLTNFRKYGDTENEVMFSNPAKFGKTAGSSEENEINKVSAATTLIIGKNNSGKTTVINALEKLCDSNKRFTANDFNLAYLNGLLQGYKESPNTLSSSLPEMSFELRIGLDEDDGDLYTKIADFLTIGVIRDKNDVVIKAKYQVIEDAKYIDNFKILLGNGDNLEIDDFLLFLDEQKFDVVFFNGPNKVEKFKLSNLVSLTIIPAYEKLNKGSLSGTFGDILQGIYTREKKDKMSRGDYEPSDLDATIAKAESDFTNNICREQAGKINSVLQKNITGRDFFTDLKAKITFEKLIKDIVHYQYIDNGLCVPEDQFGLGYTRLMLVLAHVLEYIHKENGNGRSSSINIIAIEEPEIHMHPQMQEYFIQDIASAISALVEENDKTLNCQLLISTHSDHIVYSKILSGNSFDYINYIYEASCYGCIVPLEDKAISNVDSKEDESKQTKKNNLNFLRRHLRLSSYSIFFADAVVLVEGYAEQILVPLYISEYDNLKNHYVSVVSVNGAHAYIYFNLLSCLQLPTVVITDLDFRTSDEKKKDDRRQVTNVKDRKTTNKTIKKYYASKKPDLNDVIKNEKTYEENDCIKLFTQTECRGYYPTSFEEALILENAECNLLNDVLAQLMSEKYKKITGLQNDETDKDAAGRKNNAEKSYDWYCSLAGKKGEFATELFYVLSTKLEQGVNASDYLKMPEYINNALMWLDALLGNQKSSQGSQEDLQ